MDLYWHADEALQEEATLRVGGLLSAARKLNRHEEVSMKGTLLGLVGQGSRALLVCLISAYHDPFPELPFGEAPS
jgi:hypothetical protein